MHVPAARQVRIPVPELLELDYDRRSAPMPPAMIAMNQDFLTNHDAEDNAGKEGSVHYWAARASNTLLHGMGGQYLAAIESVFPSRKAQGRLYMLGGMIIAKYVQDLEMDDIETIVELWNAAPTEQLSFAAELGMRRELSEATNGTLQNVEACLQAACTYWS